MGGRQGSCSEPSMLRVRMGLADLRVEGKFCCLSCLALPVDIHKRGLGTISPVDIHKRGLGTISSMDIHKMGLGTISPVAQTASSWSGRSSRK